MAITHQVNMGFVRGNDAPLNASLTTTDSTEQNADVALTTSETGHLCAFVFTRANLKSLFLLADHAVNVRRNASNGAIDIALQAGVPYIWMYASGLTIPFGADITALYLDNTYAGATNVNIRMLLHEA